MDGLIALVGAGEYLPVMDEIDRYLLALVSADGRAPRVVCLPTAAGREGDESISRWSRMGEEHFRRLGADVTAVRIIDRASAEDPQFEPILASADLIYFSGGDPTYLYETMQGSRAWVAVQKAWAHGAVYAGCSAGAMILALRMPNFRRAGLSTAPAFGIVPAAFIMPHFDQIRGPWKIVLDFVRSRLPDGNFMLGIDENTALVGRLGGGWRVMGQGKVHVITRAASREFGAGETLPLGSS